MLDASAASINRQGGGAAAAADRRKIDRRLTITAPFACSCCFRCCRRSLSVGLERRTLRFLLICVIGALVRLVKDRERNKGAGRKKEEKSGERGGSAHGGRVTLFFLTLPLFDPCSIFPFSAVSLRNRALRAPTSARFLEPFSRVSMTILSPSLAPAA